jgi:hypothetical protein
MAERGFSSNRGPPRSDINDGSTPAGRHFGGTSRDAEISHEVPSAA